MGFIVAIDGPASTGKGTLAKKIADEFGMINVDTGAMYRCVAYEMIRKGISLKNIDEIKKILKRININFVKTTTGELVYLNNTDVTVEIRSKAVNDFVSQVSGITEVRLDMSDKQRKMGLEKEIVMEGRDIGTFVFPNADVKFYLDANVEERAKRRFKECQEKNMEIPYEAILENIKFRDDNDKNKKEIGALKIAEDAIVIDTTNLNVDEVFGKMKEELIKVKGGK